MMAEQGSVDLDWLPACFTVLTKTDTHIAGFVSTEQELETVLECHKRATMTSFNIWSNDREKKEKSPHRILWQVEDFSNNVPLIVTNRLIYSCQHGKGRNRKTSEELCTGEEHAYTGKRKRLQIQTTKKKNCPAELFVRHITRYNDFTVPEGASRARKQMALDQLGASLKKQEKLNTSKMIHMSLPLKNAHENHNVSIESAFSRNIHPAVREKIHEYVSLGITTVPFLKKVLKQYVKNELCTADVIPPQVHDQAYYPSNHSIQNHVHLALVAGKYSGLDQVNLEKKISSWKLEDPDAHFFFRKCTEVEDDSVKKEQEADVCNTQSFEHDASLLGEKMETGFPFLQSSEETCDSENPEPDPTKQNTFLFIHQNKEQQRLLQRYGEMVLLDATYKTSKYALPLFLVVVRTNVGYKPVAEFICESETTEAISEALKI
ncbi:uncharacterized protein LOC111189631 isoform X1 [Astyanax mexicanus]|uniref:uncharacterized protein LOC111189631 isoform X1 n=1 Tax=Astyanax mexicanus TaxID=7994 RepID=UPI0020CAB6F2|nr:uncharacterized protein LOC111189631 isoform X1 [Astyanax mexicanus]XP_049330200.1 uncharacterized protein LOC111189631 isoform X1 [Astyanax mexicanus]XP_049330201.1 uncharacterized protein LOC111189631 isoform X1 [Astyanax mexicanus]